MSDELEIAAAASMAIAIYGGALTSPTIAMPASSAESAVDGGALTCPTIAMPASSAERAVDARRPPPPPSEPVAFFGR